MKSAFSVSVRLPVRPCDTCVVAHVHEYDLIADWFRADRSLTVGVREALEVAAKLGDTSLILDVGCGNGIPVAKALSAKGHRVVGLDSSRRMLAHLRADLPDIPAVCGDARACPFASATFDAAISMGMLFHLRPLEQAAAFASVSRVLKPDAPFLFTAAEIEDASDEGITGEMNGVTFHYWAVHSYRTMLAESGFKLLNVHDDPGVATYYLASNLP